MTDHDKRKPSDGGAPSDPEEFLASWGYVSGREAYATELRELVRKSMRAERQGDSHSIW